MGRMLDTLKLGDGRRSTVVAVKPEAPGRDCVVEWEIGADVPFVEIGGPNKKVEISPGLQLHAAQPVQPPHPPVEKTLAGVAIKSVALTQTTPMMVAFEAWPQISAVPAGIAAEVLVYHQPDHPTSHAYANLLNQMRGALKTDGASSLLLVGLKPNVGATTVLLNLAVVAALKDKARVIVVEANGMSDLAPRLGRIAYAGWPDVLDGTLAIEQAIVKTALPTLHLLPGGTHNAQTSEAMAWLSAWLRQRYDLVFFDGPMLTATAELNVQVPHVNGVYLVLPRSDGAVTKDIAQAITRMGGRLCGLIHTQFDM